MFACYKFATRSLILRHLKVWLLYISIYMRTFSGTIWKRAKKEVGAKFILVYLRGREEIFPPRVS